MTIAQFIVAYSVCWWLVLFMVLPHQAQAEQSPQTGNAPSAPANPQIKKKCIWASALAFIPTALIYLVATQAKAEETIYHVGGGCNKSSRYVASDDLMTADGHGVGDKQVKPADLESNSQFNVDSVDIPIAIPSDNYIGAGHNVDLSESFIGAGKLTVKKDGDALLNGKSISNDPLDSGNCNEKK